MSKSREAVGTIREAGLADPPFDFDDLFRAQYARVTGVISRVVRDPARAEELAADAFLRLWRTPGAHGAGASAWVLRTALRLGIDELRRATRRARYAPFLRFVRDVPTPEDSAAAGEERRRVLRALSANSSRAGRSARASQSRLQLRRAGESARLDYPQWRGRDRDGAASGFIEPSAWPAELSRRWTVPVGQGYATPIIVGHRVFMFTRRNGDELMTALNAFSSPYTHAITPIAHAGRIVVGAQNMGIRALRPRRRGTEWVVDTEWRNDDVSPGMTNPVVIADTLFGLSERRRGQFFALDANTGATLWPGPPRQAENSAVVKTERLLFLLNDDAELIVARAGRAGFEPVARHVVADSPTWAQPAISGGRIFVKDVDTLTLWTLTPPPR